jgi:hypothetical protein
MKMGIVEIEVHPKKTNRIIINSTCKKCHKALVSSVLPMRIEIEKRKPCVYIQVSPCPECNKRANKENILVIFREKDIIENREKKIPTGHFTSFCNHCGKPNMIEVQVDPKQVCNLKTLSLEKAKEVQKTRYPTVPFEG